MTDGNGSVLYVFPGQGAQYQGMGSDLFRDFPVARRLYGEASEILGYDLAELSFEDPAQQLNLTRFTQPALLTHEIACFQVYKELVGDLSPPGAAAGHSLGEYAALVAAEALSFEDALRLVQKRGELMGEYGEGELLALPLELEAARALAERHYCQVASCNLPDQNVVGGAAKDISALADEMAALHPTKKAVLLKTEGAFHTNFMTTAARHFRSVLDATGMAAPKFPVLSNYTGGFHDPDVSSIKARLFFQLFNPVNWIGCLQTAFEKGLTTCIELGGGLGSGPEPDTKRPNLAGVIKKALRRSAQAGAHLAAINSDTIRATASQVKRD